MTDPSEVATDVVQIGPFVVLRKLGEGAMGVVYAGYDVQLDRKVAIKLVHRHLLNNPVVRVRMMREAQAMARLSSPNVVHVYQVGEHDDGIYMAMEYIDGLTLGAWLRARPRPWQLVLRTVCDAGRGLAAAHQAGLIHRDFKPKPSRPPPKAPLSAKRRGSPTIGAFEGRRFAQEWSEVVRMAQSWPKIEARSCHTPSEA